MSNCLKWNFAGNKLQCALCFHIPFSTVMFSSGTSWLQEIVYLLSLQPGEIRGKIVDAVPFLEETPTVEQLNMLLSKSGPRILKTHLPKTYFTRELNNANKDIKVLVGKRNPKDALLSYYHFYRNVPVFGPFHGNWDEFFQLFKEKRLVHGDYFDFYEGWEYEAAKPEANGKILFVNYEDLKDNLLGSVQRVSAFLGKGHSEERHQFVASNCEFEVMKSNPMACPLTSGTGDVFFRKGIVGEWKNTFTQEQSEYVDLLDQQLSRKL